MPEMCEKLLANPLIEDYEIQSKFGVVRFPGSCDEVDALLAARRVGEAEVAAGTPMPTYAASTP